MKKILLFFVPLFLIKFCFAQNITLLLGNQPLIEGVVYDNGQYNGFPFPIWDGGVYSVHKRSNSHGAGGDLVLLNPYNVASVISMCGSDVTNLSFGKINNRWYLAWQNGGDAINLKVSYSDDKGTTWASPSTVIMSRESYLSPFPPTLMPSGKVIFDVYQYESGEPKYFSEFHTTDEGASWQINEGFIVRTGTVYPNEPCNEFKRIITDNTGNDATCKVVIIARSNVYASANQFSSSDGGQTWTHSLDLIDVWSEPQGGTNGSKPIGAIKESNGKFLLVVGDRNFTGGVLQCDGAYIEVTASDLYSNVNINTATPITFYHKELVNANINGSAIDWGYPVSFIPSINNEVWCRVYDTSLDTPNPGVTRRCLIKQIRVK